MRSLALIVLLCAAASLVAQAATPTDWEIYLIAPSPERARAVTHIEYSVDKDATASGERLEKDLGILRYEVASGDEQSARLAFRAQRQFGASAAIAEYLDTIIGRAARSNPRAYLRAAFEYGGECTGLKATGDFFVDRDEARATEDAARAAALRSITDAKLIAQRDKCLAALAPAAH